MLRLRPALFVLSLVSLAGTATAQNFSGTWSVPTGTGANLNLQLRQDAAGRITGTLTGNTAFQVQAQMQNGQLSGYAIAAGGRLYMEGQLQGEGLVLALAEVGPDGQPQVQTARTVMMTRTGGAGAAGGGMAMGGQGATGGQGAMGSGGAVAGGSPQDRQIAQLLERSAWCYMSYSQTSGTSRTERVVFRADGSGMQSSGGETYNSGPNGTVAGQSQGGQPFQWRVQGGNLMVTIDGAQWDTQPLRITQNSSGYPIVTARNKEYAMCN